jgi:hypothetical protein
MYVTAGPSGALLGDAALGAVAADDARQGEAARVGRAAHQPGRRHLRRRTPQDLELRQRTASRTGSLTNGIDCCQCRVGTQ